MIRHLIASVWPAAAGVGGIRRVSRRSASPHSPTLNIEAYPDPAPPIIEIIASGPASRRRRSSATSRSRSRSRSRARPGLKYIRSNTVYALGFIRLQFEYGRDYNFVRQQAHQPAEGRRRCPTGVQPVISPAGGISEIFRYQLKGPPGDGPDRAEDAAGLGGGAQAADRAGRGRRRGARRQDQGIPGRDRPQPDDGLRPDAAADHDRDLDRQRQCRRPHHRDRRAVGQRARHRRRAARSRTSATSC